LRKIARMVNIVKSLKHLRALLSDLHALGFKPLIGLEWHSCAVCIIMCGDYVALYVRHNAL